MCIPHIIRPKGNDMYAWIEFEDGSNPYISMGNDNFQKWAEHWDLELVGFSPAHFIARRRKRENIGDFLTVPNDYHARKAFWRDWIIVFSDESVNFSESWSDVVEWTDFAEFIARKYGLVREFRENGIL